MTQNKVEPRERILMLEKCKICQKILRIHNRIHFSRENFDPICRACFNKFTKNEIDLMIYLFNRWGGYFGEGKREDKSVKEIVKSIFNETRTFALLDGLDKELYLIYRGLLYGHGPREFYDQILTATTEVIE